MRSLNFLRRWRSSVLVCGLLLTACAAPPAAQAATRLTNVSAKADSARIERVACVTAKLCTASGDHVVWVSNDPTNGVWKGVELPGNTTSETISAECLSETFCYAVIYGEKFIWMTTDPFDGAWKRYAMPASPGFAPGVCIAITVCKVANGSGTSFGNPATGSWSENPKVGPATCLSAHLCFSRLDDLAPGSGPGITPLRQSTTMTDGSWSVATGQIPGEQCLTCLGGQAAPTCFLAIGCFAGYATIPGSATISFSANPATTAWRQTEVTTPINELFPSAVFVPSVQCDRPDWCFSFVSATESLINTNPSANVWSLKKMVQLTDLEPIPGFFKNAMLSHRSCVSKQFCIVSGSVDGKTTKEGWVTAAYGVWVSSVATDGKWVLTATDAPLPRVPLPSKVVALPKQTIGAIARTGLLKIKLPVATKGTRLSTRITVSAFVASKLGLKATKAAQPVVIGSTSVTLKRAGTPIISTRLTKNARTALTTSKLAKVPVSIKVTLKVNGTSNSVTKSLTLKR